METNASISIRRQAQQMLDRLPPEGLEELARFIEFLRFKYQLTFSPQPENESATPTSTDPDIPPDSLTARYRGFVQSPLSVAELTELDPNNDPILSVIGIADVDPFAEDIDDLLYGPAEL